MRIAAAAPSEIPARRANTLQVMKMCQALASLGHEVHLLVPSPAAAQTKDQPGWETLQRHYGLQPDPAFAIDWLPAQPRMKRFDFSLRSVLWARRWKADLFYTRLPQAAALGSSLGMPTIFEIHDLPQGKSGPALLRRFCAGRGARRLVTITQALACDLAEKFGVPPGPPFTIIAPDGVDLERYNDLPTPARARQLLLENSGASSMPAPSGYPDGDWNSQAWQRLLRPDRFMAGYTGHLYPGRGSEMLIELAAQLPEAAFLIAGGEPAEVKNLRRVAGEHGLENVLITGFIPNAQLPLYQAACDALLMPYQLRVEASSGGDIGRYLSPMKLFEYLACERVILSSDLPVLREVLTPQNAILLPANDLQHWSSALAGLMADPQSGAQISRQARQDANLYTWKGRAEKILTGMDVPIRDERRRDARIRDEHIQKENDEGAATQA
jgi:glycosyltransferase involved in cell wall biosynthesis